MFYGLDRIATVQPTSRLSERAFGRENAALIFGWIQAAHQIGAESATCGAGLLRTTTGTYAGSFFASGCVGVAASMLVLLIGRSRAEPISMQVLPARS